MKSATGEAAERTPPVGETNHLRRRKFAATNRGGAGRTTIVRIHIVLRSSTGASEHRVGRLGGPQPLAPAVAWPEPDHWLAAAARAPPPGPRRAAAPPPFFGACAWAWRAAPRHWLQPRPAALPRHRFSGRRFFGRSGIKRSRIRHRSVPLGFAARSGTAAGLARLLVLRLGYWLFGGCLRHRLQLAVFPGNNLVHAVRASPPPCCSSSSEPSRGGRRGGHGGGGACGRDLAASSARDDQGRRSSRSSWAVSSSSSSSSHPPLRAGDPLPRPPREQRRLEAGALRRRAGPRLDAHLAPSKLSSISTSTTTP
jgi:hypothetical protein